MKPSLFRIFQLGAFLACIAVTASAAAQPTKASDHAAELLARQGSVPLAAAGPHVERGTFRVQVAATLGRPDLVLPDGTWLYRDHRIEGSTATGTLVVRLEGGRVSSLALATPAAIAELRAAPHKTLPHELLATK